jgi:hypothetical protein
LIRTSGKSVRAICREMDVSNTHEEHERAAPMAASVEG